MIYADVTSACLLPLQSGIPRTTRGLYQQLVKHRPQVTPMLWQPFYHGYAQLSPRAHQMLEDPFSPRRGLPWTEQDWILPLLWASGKEACRGFLRLPLSILTSKEDTLLVTSLFPDNRLLYLKKHLNRPGRKVVIFHDAIPLSDPHVPRIGRVFHRFLLRLLADFDLVICVSRSAEADLIRLWEQHAITPAPTRVIPWPVPFSIERPAFQPPDTRIKKILYVSRLKRVKNHAALLQACENLWDEKNDFKLELIGCEDVPYESRGIQDAVQRLRDRGFPVVWKGHVSEKELHDAYSSCTFTVFPSLMEGFGLPIVESLWHGRPVICSSHGAMGEVAEGEGKNGAGTIPVDLNHPGALESAIRDLLHNPARCSSLAWEAYQRPVRTWEDYWRDLEPHL
jgi:glycosyltransferase involved in cell wall biosynthesis